MSDVLPKIEIPPPEPITPEEIERRKKIVERILALRESMPPLGFDAAELIRQIRDEEEPPDA